VNAAQAPHASTTCDEHQYLRTQRKPHRVLTSKPVKVRVMNPAVPVQVIMKRAAPGC
jgi:hypothetical protein